MIKIVGSQLCVSNVLGWLDACVGLFPERSLQREQKCEVLCLSEQLKTFGGSQQLFTIKYPEFNRVFQTEFPEDFHQRFYKKYKPHHYFSRILY